MNLQDFLFKEIHEVRTRRFDRNSQFLRQLSHIKTHKLTHQTLRTTFCGTQDFYCVTNILLLTQKEDPFEIIFFLNIIC